MILLCVFAASVAGIKAVSAYYTDREISHNEIRPGDSNIEIEEKFEPPDELKPGAFVPKQVNIKNKGKSSAFIRCRLLLGDEIWAPYLVFSENEKDWEKAKDGYYYFKQAVPAGTGTSELISNIRIKDETPEELLKNGFSLSVYAEAYQQGDFTAGDYRNAWIYFDRNKKSMEGQ